MGWIKFPLRLIPIRGPLRAKATLSLSYLEALFLDTIDQNSQQTPDTPGAVLAGQPSSLPAPPPAPPTPPPQVTQQQISTMKHHADLGRAARVLFGAPSLDLNGNPTPQKPGQLFRNILAATLLGASIGAENPQPSSKVGGFLSGLARGATGIQQQDYQRQQDQFARQQKLQQMSLEEKKAADEHMLHQATAAHLVAETAAFHHQQQWHDQEVLDKKNAAAREYVRALDEEGASPAHIPINGVVPPENEYNASDLAAAFVRDPSILRGPKGTVRHFVDLHDAGDLDYVPGRGWLNASGNPVDLGKSTTVKVYDVPENLYKQRFSRTGTELNTLAGYQLIPKNRENDSFDVTLDQVAALQTQNIKNLNAQAQAKQRTANANKSAGGATKRGTPAQFAAVESKKAAALSKAEAIYRKAAADGDENAVANREQAKVEAQRAYENEIKALGGSVAPSSGIKPPTGKTTVFDLQNNPHFVDSDKLKSFLADPQYKGWHQ